jgi:hypothetical protein
MLILNEMLQKLDWLTVVCYRFGIYSRVNLCLRDLIIRKMYIAVELIWLK